MRHRKSGKALGRTADHRRALKRNLVTELFRHERIQTTTTKAKESRHLAERLVTYAKRGGLGRRRLAARYIQDESVLKRLFDDVAPRFAERPGGYTRIVKVGRRRGDGGEIAILELVGAGEVLAAAAKEKHKDKDDKKKK
ncbi:MAG: 50S ribosomal protein L17 [Candidatus Eisenbacteria bacterium]|uniref:Large ribosomal subunit protein bL17 n=1 Tax=Eiseniibacteriota bacterium TaxID=2212470 RepID=A0A948WCR1_UNCEI|nr:50S ribosomal protein L17 [Candidatus Eisenbacteria bacterium]MBU1950615.1 50S ribosomal protein L17 [Candidatus Eisenbacteria bacterium]MBU2691148.1 50S ribosomal protein L17 [Candidatus Eisenbacteria bacterium]